MSLVEKSEYMWHSKYCDVSGVVTLIKTILQFIILPHFDSGDASGCNGPENLGSKACTKISFYGSAPPLGQGKYSLSDAQAGKQAT